MIASLLKRRRMRKKKTTKKSEENTKQDNKQDNNNKKGGTERDEEVLQRKQQPPRRRNDDDDDDDDDDENDAGDRTTEKKRENGKGDDAEGGDRASKRQVLSARLAVLNYHDDDGLVEDVLSIAVPETENANANERTKNNGIRAEGEGGGEGDGKVYDVYDAEEEVQEAEAVEEETDDDDEKPPEFLGADISEVVPGKSDVEKTNGTAEAATSESEQTDQKSAAKLSEHPQKPSRQLPRFPTTGTSSKEQDNAKSDKGEKQEEKREEKEEEKESEELEEFRRRLQGYLMVHHPSLLHATSSLLKFVYETPDPEVIAERRKRLHVILWKTFGEPLLDPETEEEHQALAKKMRAGLKAFFAIHAPEKMSNIDSIVAHTMPHGNQGIATLTRMMREKYGASPLIDLSYDRASSSQLSEEDGSGAAEEEKSSLKPAKKSETKSETKSEGKSEAKSEEKLQGKGEGDDAAVANGGTGVQVTQGQVPSQEVTSTGENDELDFAIAMEHGLSESASEEEFEACITRLRAQLKAFYEARDPQSLPMVDRLVDQIGNQREGAYERYKALNEGLEDQFAANVEDLAVEIEVDDDGKSAHLSRGPVKGNLTASTLRRMEATANPDQSLFQISPEALTAEVSVKQRGMLQASLRQFYEQHNPSKLSAVDDLISYVMERRSQRVSRVRELERALQNRYGENLGLADKI